MSLFMVIEEAKVYRSFYVYAKNVSEAKELVHHGGDLRPHATYPMNGDKGVVEVWIEEGMVPVWQQNGLE